LLVNISDVERKANSIFSFGHCIVDNSSQQNSYPGMICNGSGDVKISRYS
jgi:hypothetical protein